MPRIRIMAVALLLGAITTAPPASADVPPAAAQREARRVAASIQHLLAADAGHRAQAVAAAMDGRVAFSALAQRILGDYVERVYGDYRGALGEADYIVLRTRSRFALEQALRERLEQDLTTLCAALAGARVELVDARTAGDLVIATLEIAPPASEARRVQLRIDAASGQVVDAEHRLGTVSRHYQALIAEARRRKLSPFVVISTLRGRPDAVVEDFGDSPSGGLPFAWRWFDRDDGKPKPYTVMGAPGRRYLRAEDHGESVILMKGAHWDPIEFPTMSWCWRADELPPGGDERNKETNDSVAGVYVVFSKTWLRVPRQVKYVWSTSLPVGTVGRRDRWARPYFVVLESGPSHAGSWRLARVDLLDTYAATYGGTPATRTEGIALLTDANSTDATASAAYADFRIWRRGAFDPQGAADACGALP